MPLSARLVAPAGVARDPRRRRAAVVAAALVVVVLLAGCVAPKNQASGAEPSPAPSAEATGDLAQYYGQQLEWTDVRARASARRRRSRWTTPTRRARRSTIALARRRATGGEPLGSLLLNPRRARGVGRRLRRLGRRRWSAPDVQAAVRPRRRSTRAASQRSSPVECVDGPGLDELLAYDARLLDRRGHPGRSSTVRRARRRVPGADRRRRSGHVDTVSAARDLDVLRAALGDDDAHLPRLLLRHGARRHVRGAVPARRVGRLVLDGALPPTLTSDGGVARARPSASRTRCAPTSPTARPARAARWTGRSTTASRRSRDLLDRRAGNPLPTGTDRDADPVARVLRHRAAAVRAVVLALPDAGADRRARAERRLDAAAAGRPVLRPAAGRHVQHELDRGVLRDQLPGQPRPAPTSTTMRAEAAQIEAAAPDRRATSSATAARCAPSGPSPRSAASTPTPPRAPRRSSSSAPPTTPRRRTCGPRSWPTSCRSGVLLTYEGEGHTAYGSSNDCIADAVDAYLLTGTVPADGTRC